MTDKRFRKAFVVQHGRHNFQPLLRWCETLVFCSTGYELAEDVLDALQKSLKDFDSATDVIVPVGNVTANCLLGVVLGVHYSGFTMAVFQEKEYHFLHTPCIQKEA